MYKIDFHEALLIRSLTVCSH